MSNVWQPLGGNGGLPSDMVTSQVVGERRFKVDQSDKSFLIEVAKGNVAGHRLVGKVAQENNSSTDYKDMWRGASDMTLSNDGIAETWEILSSSDEDKAGGTGATQAVINYLDNNYIEQSVTVTLNGTTPVQIATNCYRPGVSVVSAVNAGGVMHNVGFLTIRVVGGDDRSFIDEIDGVSTDGVLVVPANHTLFFIQVLTFLPKNVDAHIKTVLKSDGETTPERAAGNLPYYQNTSTFEVLARITAQEKTTLKYRCKTSSAGQQVNRVGEFLLVNNDYL